MDGPLSCGVLVEGLAQADPTASLAVTCGQGEHAAAAGACHPYICLAAYCAPAPLLCLQRCGCLLLLGSQGLARQTALSAGPAVSLTGPDALLTAGRRLLGARQWVLLATCRGFVALAVA